MDRATTAAAGTAAAPAPTAGTILALYLGEYKGVACACGRATARLDATTTSRHELRKLVRAAAPSPPPPWPRRKGVKESAPPAAVEMIFS
jgi:hypothetical protein